MSDPTNAPLSVAVVTPEGAAFEGVADNVVIPAHDGEVAFFPMHAPFVGAIGVGELRVTQPDGVVKRWFLEGGVAQVLDNVVTVLAEKILPVDDLDRGTAEEAVAEALATVPTTDEAFADRDRLLAAARAKMRITS